MQPEQTVGPAQPQQRQQRVRVESPVGQYQITGLELVHQPLQQIEFMLVLITLGVVQQNAGGQAEHAHQFQKGKTAAGFLSARLGISALVFDSVGQSGAGAIDHLDPQAAPEPNRFLGLGGRGATQARQDIPGQAQPGLTPAAGACGHRAMAVQGKERLDLTDHLPTGALGIEHLIKKAKEGAADRIDAIAAVGALVGLGEQPWRQPGAEEEVQVQEVLLAQLLDAGAQGGKPGAEGGEEGRFHRHSNTTVPIDTHAKMSSMKDAPDALAALKAQYHRLRQSLARIGYISQGSVLQRSVAASGRSGYQWTRKVAQKTVSVSLSQPQFEAMKRAVANERKLWKTVQEMERVSRQIIFASASDTRRRKRLSKKVLGLI